MNPSGALLSTHRTAWLTSAQQHVHRLLFSTEITHDITSASRRNSLSPWVTILGSNSKEQKVNNSCAVDTSPHPSTTLCSTCFHQRRRKRHQAVQTSYQHCTSVRHCWPLPAIKYQSSTKPTSMLRHYGPLLSLRIPGYCWVSLGIHWLLRESPSNIQPSYQQRVSSNHHAHTHTHRQ